MTTTIPHPARFNSDADAIRESIRTIDAAQAALEGLARAEGCAPAHPDWPTARAIGRATGALGDALGALFDARDRLTQLATGRASIKPSADAIRESLD